MQPGEFDRYRAGYSSTKEKARNVIYEIYIDLSPIEDNPESHKYRCLQV